MAATTNIAEQQRLALHSGQLLRQAAFINGRWITAAETLDVINPATQQLLGRVPALGAAETEHAVAGAQRAFESWRRVSAGERGTILQRWFELIMENQEDLARLMTAEQGKPLSESRGEVAYAASFIEWFAQESRRAYGQVIPGHLADKRLVVLREPVGVVAAVTPWNFPAAMITRKVGPALAAGCTVVLKPSELTPFSALALAWLASQAGVPAGVFNVVTGEPTAIGEVLTSDPRVRKFTFTGSTRVGKLLAARCMSTVKHVSLELGGNAPFIVFDDADVNRAVEGAMASKFRNSGQTCVCANRILVQRGIHDVFVAKLCARVATLVVGDGLAGVTQQGPLINAAAVDKVQRHVEDAMARGGKLLKGGARLQRQFLPAHGHYRCESRGRNVRRGDLRTGRRHRQIRYRGPGHTARQRHHRGVGRILLHARSEPCLAGLRGTAIRHGGLEYRADIHHGGALRWHEGIGPGPRGLKLRDGRVPGDETRLHRSQ